MDVLELPRPVINFLRTMSKEMHRYSLCWDIYGGSENVTLTLTWKLNCEDSSDSGEARPETKSPKSSRKIKKQTKQLQHSKLDTLKTCSRFLADKRNAQSDYKPKCDDLNPYFYTKDKFHESRRFFNSSMSPVYSSSSATPIKNSHKIFDNRRSRGKSLENYEKKDTIYEDNKFNSINREIIPQTKDTPESDPWIRRDSFEKNVNRADINDKEVKLLSLIESITGEESATELKNQSISVTNNAGPCNKTNSGSVINTGFSSTSSSNNSGSSKTTNGAYNSTTCISKVTFDPNLEYI